jgi:hypothetical protein
MSEFYFFGVKDPEHLGHHLYDRNLHIIYEHPGRNLPGWMYHCLDATLAPPDSQEERIATLSYLAGWTVLAFWDRSGDKRGQSNAAIVSPGIRTFEYMVELLRAGFPLIHGRLAGPITPHATVYKCYGTWAR